RRIQKRAERSVVSLGSVVVGRQVLKARIDLRLRKSAHPEPTAQGRFSVTKQIVAKPESRPEGNELNLRLSLDNAGRAGKQHPIEAAPHAGHDGSDVDSRELFAGDGIDRYADTGGSQPRVIQPECFLGVI